MQLFFLQLLFTGISLICALMQFPLTSCVISLSLAFIFCGLMDQFDNYICTYITGAVYFIITLFLPAAGCFLPVFLYNCCVLSISEEKKRPVLIATLFVWLFFYPQFAPAYWFLNIFLSIVAVLNATAMYKIDILNHTICRNHDTDRELQILLEQKNAALLENTQYEIETATLRERNRIAREIHDNVGHLLTRSILQTGALNMINQDEKTTPHLEMLSDTLNQAMDSIRSSVHNLHQSELDLHTSLKTYLSTIDTIQVNLQYEIQHLSGEMSCHFLSIIKEAVHNTIKHSNADRINIHLIEHPNFYQVSIADNGTSSNVSQTTPGIGLSSMLERVQLMNGSMEIFHEQGFRIFITIMK